MIDHIKTNQLYSCLDTRSLTEQEMSLLLVTNLQGRLRNTNLPKNKALFPLFEAVVNAIHSIDERIESDTTFTLEQSQIKIRVEYSNQIPIPGMEGTITGFSITDNGVGFTDANYKSFQTLDSEYKMSKGCRGIGRLLWLKAFSSVAISSVYKNEEGKLNSRSFEFNADSNIVNEVEKLNVDTEQQTIVDLLNLESGYCEKIAKRTSTIAQAILEHCLWYFLREGGSPNITIEGDETISLNQAFDEFGSNKIQVDSFSIGIHEFDVTHVKLKNCSVKNKLLYCAANREVLGEDLKGKITGLFDDLKEGEESFRYMCFVTSDYLTERVTPDRLGFTIQKDTDSIELDTPSLSQIESEVLKSVQGFLDGYLEEGKKASKERLHKFVDEKAPRYKPILQYLREEEKIVSPTSNDKDLDLYLHKKLYEIESSNMEVGHRLSTEPEAEK